MPQIPGESEGLITILIETQYHNIPFIRNVDATNVVFFVLYFRAVHPTLSLHLSMSSGADPMAMCQC